ncbi:hypothetical protein FRC17_008214 [Serendipita sp. 399]|nr:hypothetical protein FRC17_008214 [Serendipita sp. 399]
MSLESAMGSTDADGELGSSNGPTSVPSTSDGSILRSPSHKAVSNQTRYPNSLSAKVVEDPDSCSQRLETFEELLAKAGYAQTRVVTPQSERLSKNRPTYSSRQDQDANVNLNGDNRNILYAASDYTVKVANFLSWAIGYAANTAPVVPQNPSTGAISDTPAILISAQSNNQAESSSMAQAAGSGAIGNGLKADSSVGSTSETDLAPKLAPSPSPVSTITPTASSTDATKPGLRTRSTTGKIRSGRKPDALAAISPRPPVNGSRTRDEVVQEGDYPNSPNFQSRPPVSHGKRSPIPNTWTKNSANGPNDGTDAHKQERNQVTFPGTGKPDAVQSTSSYQRSHRSHRSMYEASTRRGKLQHGHPQREGRRRRLPSDYLLSRNGTPNTRPADLLASPVTVLCRSSSVGPPTKSKRSALPLLSPSGGISEWPLDHSSAGDPAAVPKITIRSPSKFSVKQSLVRSGSTSSAKYHSSTPPRLGSGYASLPRVGSGFTSISRSGTGTSAMSSSIGLPLEAGSSSHSPVVPSYRDYFQNGRDTTHESDEDSENEPRLSNIIVPHVSPIGGPHSRPHPGPVGRQQSIQSLRACLRRHKSVSQANSPAVTTFPLGISAPFEDASSPLQPSSVVNGASSVTEHDAVTRKAAMSSKRSSFSSAYAGNSVRSRKRVFDEDFDQERGPRRVEGADQPDEGTSLSRGRRSTRSILNLGLGNLRWNSASSSSNAQAPTSSGYVGVGSRHSSSSRMGRTQKRPPTDRELEQEKLLWGTSWGRRAGDQDRPRP